MGNSDVTRLYDENNAYYEPYQDGAFFTEYNIAKRRHGNGVVYEGDDGLFTQSWYPICRSREVPVGEVIGRGFLDGQVAVFRGESGGVSAVSAYCPHIGAHLARGQVVGDELECAFHRWTFDAAGHCTRTGCGDRVPAGSSLFKYPTVERYGLVWIFNGVDPQWSIPEIGWDDNDLVFHSDIPHVDINNDPWVFMTNTFDYNHFRCVHGMQFKDPTKNIQWTDHSATYHLAGNITTTGNTFDYNLGIYGNNIFWQNGEADGRWFTFLFPACIHRPGTMRCYFIIAAKKSDDTAAAEEILNYGMELERTIVGQDLEILNSMRLTRGNLTKSDVALGMFVNHIAKLPRVNPGGDYIR